MKSTENETFTIEKGIEIQAEYLCLWKKVLKPDCFNMLAYHCETLNMILKSGTAKDEFGNKLAMNGYSVFRGQNIDMYVHNKLMRS